MTVLTHLHHATGVVLESHTPSNANCLSFKFRTCDPITGREVFGGHTIVVFNLPPAVTDILVDALKRAEAVGQAGDTAWPEPAA